MRSSIKHYLLLVGIVLAFTQCQKEVLDTRSVLNEQEAIKSGHLVDDDCVVVQDLWAGAGQNDTGKGTLVGSVKATVSGTILHVEYNLDANWVLTEAHLWVGKNLHDIPQNAAPGQFPFKKDVHHESVVHFEVDLTKLGIEPGDPIYVAAHGVVKGVDGIEVLAKMLPMDVSYKVKYFKNFPGYPDVAPLSYFQISIEDGYFYGKYKGWCLDSSTPISQDKLINGKAYSSYGELPADLFHKPQNLPAVNWIINNIFVGDMSDIGKGAFTMGDLQRAFWILIENDPNLDIPGGVGPYNLERVAEIVEKALEHGLSFVPVCGQKLVVIIVAPNEQHTIIEVPVPCAGKADTVWAYGQYTFKGLNVANKWGWVFSVVCNEE
jgi:hypothetical protein